MGLFFWRGPGDEDHDDDERSDDGKRYCQQCGAEVSRSDYFNDEDCPECGKPCSSPF